MTMSYGTFPTSFLHNNALDISGAIYPSLLIPIFYSHKPSIKPEDIIDSSEIMLIKELFITSIDVFERYHEANHFDNYTPWLANPYGFQVSNIEDAMDFLTYHDGLYAGYIIALKRPLRMNKIDP